MPAAPPPCRGGAKILTIEAKSPSRRCTMGPIAIPEAVRNPAGRGRFGRVKPKENFNTKNGSWSAWQVAARFSYLDLDDEFVEGGKVWDVTAGLNWYPFPNARVMLNYIHSRVEDRLTSPNPDLDGDADIAQVRFQIDF